MMEYERNPYDEIERLRADLAAERALREKAEQEAAGLRADAERMDWVERHPNHERMPYRDDDSGQWATPYLVSNAGGAGGGVGLRYFDSLREAIDAARAGSGE